MAWRWASGWYVRRCRTLGAAVAALERRRAADQAATERMVRDWGADKKEIALHVQARIQDGDRIKQLEGDLLAAQHEIARLEAAAASCHGQEAARERRVAETVQKFAAERDTAARWAAVAEHDRDAARREYKELVEKVNAAHEDWANRLAAVAEKVKAKEEAVAKLSEQVEHLRKSLTLAEGLAADRGLEIGQLRGTVAKAVEVQDQFRATLKLVAAERGALHRELVVRLSDLVRVWEAIHGTTVKSGWEERIDELKAGPVVNFDECFGQVVPANSPVAWRGSEQGPRAALAELRE